MNRNKDLKMEEEYSDNEEQVEEEVEEEDDEQLDDEKQDEDEEDGEEDEEEDEAGDIPAPMDSNNNTAGPSKGQKMKSPMAALAKGKDGAGVETKKKKAKVEDMVIDAIKFLNDRNGSSMPAIQKYISSNFQIDDERQLLRSLKRSLKKSTTDGRLVLVKRSYKLSPEVKNQLLSKEKNKMKKKKQEEKTKEKEKQKALEKKEKEKEKGKGKKKQQMQKAKPKNGKDEKKEKGAKMAKGEMEKKPKPEKSAAKADKNMKMKKAAAAAKEGVSASAKKPAKKAMKTKMNDEGPKDDYEEEPVGAKKMKLEKSGAKKVKKMARKSIASLIVPIQGQKKGAKMTKKKETETTAAAAAATADAAGKGAAKKAMK